MSEAFNVVIPIDSSMWVLNLLMEMRWAAINLALSKPYFSLGHARVRICNSDLLVEEIIP